jgi:hypothetical protein
MTGGNRSNVGNDKSARIATNTALRDEVEVLRKAVDVLRTELQYLVRNQGANRVAETFERLHVTSPPLDPAAEDCEQRVTGRGYKWLSWSSGVP